MDKPGYTPGPWKATRSNPAEGYDCWWITANHRNNFEKDLATVAGGASTSEANARLIAAAPEMFEALRALIDAIDTGNLEMNSPEIGGHDDIPQHPWHEQWLHHARDAIQKARGDANVG